MQIYSSLVGWDPDPEDVEDTVRAFKLVQVSTVSKNENNTTVLSLTKCKKSIDH